MTSLSMPKGKKRILLVDLGDAMAGVEAYLDGLATFLQPDADLFAICVMTELATKLEKRGVRVTLIPKFSRLRILRFITALAVLPWLILRNRIGVIQINGFLESILLVPALLLNRYTIYTRHGPFENELYAWHKHPTKFLPRLAARYCAHLASRVICVSETVGTQVREVLPVERVAVIPNWVTVLPDRKRRPVAPTQLLNILYAGRLERYKGLHLLIDALRDVPASRLTVIGDGKYRKTLENLALGLDVEFAGFQDDPARFYNAADICVMPSLGPEGLPLVALEAMSYGLPCLFSDLPVHREITDNGRAAMLFRSGDTADLRDKLSRLIDSDSLRARYSECAYQNIKSKYLPSVARQAYRELFQVQS